MNSPRENTSVYPMVQAQVCPIVIKKVPNLDPEIKGDTRNRRRAAYCSIAIINELEGHSDPIILQGEMPQFLIDGDTLEDVKARLFAEMTEVFDNAQKVLNGETTIEELQNIALGEQQKAAAPKELPQEKVEVEVPE